MLTNLMAFRKSARQMFQKYQFPIEVAFKFIVSFAAYSRIVASLNYSTTLGKFIFKLLFGLAGAILPPIVTILLCACVAVFEVFAASPIMALLVLAVLVVLYCFAARFSGKFAYAVIAIPLLVKFNLHYVVALLLGLTATPMAIFPSIVGIMVYYVFGAAKNSIVDANIKTVDDVLTLYLKFIDDIFANKEMFFIAAIFAVVIILMWFMRKIRFNYSFEITVASGGVFMIILHAILKIFFPMSVSVGTVIIGTIISMIVVYIVQFFILVLDYTSVENVQFEDDDYYYYVQAVPKLDKVVLGEVVPTEREGSDKEPEVGSYDLVGFIKLIRKTIVQRFAEQSGAEKNKKDTLEEDEEEDYKNASEDSSDDDKE